MLINKFTRVTYDFCFRGLSITIHTKTAAAYSKFDGLLAIESEYNTAWDELTTELQAKDVFEYHTVDIFRSHEDIIFVVRFEEVKNEKDLIDIMSKYLGDDSSYVNLTKSVELNSIQFVC